MFLRTYITTKGRRRIIKDISDEDKFLLHKGEAYFLDGACVRFKYRENDPIPIPYLMFEEGNPFPTNSSVVNSGTSKFDETVYINDMENTARVSHGEGGFWSFLDKLANPKYIILYIMIIAGIAIIYQIVTKGGKLI